jgi:hypothetical protein
VVIDFDALAKRTVVTNQYPSVTFASVDEFTTNFVVQEADLAGSPPNYICSGLRVAGPDCSWNTSLSFTTPVNNLSFAAVAVGATGQAAVVDVYEHGSLSATVPIMGHGDPLHPVHVDLSAYHDVTQIVLRDITDDYGIGWDDFDFLTTAPPPPPPTYRYFVTDTCADGSCGLKIEDGPGYANHTQIGTKYDGDPVDIVCQDRGELVGPSPSNGSVSDIWDRLDSGGWVSDLYVTTPVVGDFSPPIPHC